MAEPAKTQAIAAGFPAFATSLMRPDAGIPEGVINPLGGREDKRYAVYRNNVAMSLKSALADIFRSMLTKRSSPSSARIVLS